MKKRVEPIPRLRVRKGATLREIYAASRKQFTAADLQKFTETSPMVPADQLLAELEAIDKAAIVKDAKKRGTRNT